eukprot:5671761-Pleurochrysis_carterae.AAC.1
MHKVPTSSGRQSHALLDAMHAPRCMHTGADVGRWAEPAPLDAVFSRIAHAQKCRRRAAG